MDEESKRDEAQRDLPIENKLSLSFYTSGHATTDYLQFARGKAFPAITDTEVRATKTMWPNGRGSGLCTTAMV